MRTAADYFGLMAYLFVMHGGVPDDVSLLAGEYPRRGSGRGASRLRVIGRRRAKPSKGNKATASPALDEAAA